jgi:hypothetical protein
MWTPGSTGVYPYRDLCRHDENGSLSVCMGRRARARLCRRPDTAALVGSAAGSVRRWCWSRRTGCRLGRSDHDVRAFGIVPGGSCSNERWQPLDLGKLLVLIGSPEVEVCAAVLIPVQSWRASVDPYEEVWVRVRSVAQRLTPERGRPAVSDTFRTIAPTRRLMCRVAAGWVSRCAAGAPHRRRAARWCPAAATVLPASRSGLPRSRGSTGLARRADHWVRGLTGRDARGAPWRRW